jgi:hypothetical protein
MAQGFLTDDTNELVIESGSFIVGDDDNQNMSLIAMNDMGQLKQTPYLGAGFRRLANAPFDTVRKGISTLKYQLNADGFKNVTVDYNNNGDVTIDGTR